MIFDGIETGAMAQASRQMLSSDNRSDRLGWVGLDFLGLGFWQRIHMLRAGFLDQGEAFLRGYDGRLSGTDPFVVELEFFSVGGVPYRVARSAPAGATRWLGMEDAAVSVFVQGHVGVPSVGQGWLRHRADETALTWGAGAGHTRRWG